MPYTDADRNPYVEMPFSTNAQIMIGCGEVKHQITARGFTAQEMTTNFFAAVDTLKAGYAARKRASQVDAGKLLALVACWMKKAEKIEGMALRLIKAAQLVQAGAVTIEQEGHYTVRSQHDPSIVYRVEHTTCPCEDWTRHAEQETYCCKHLLATKIVAKLTATT